MTVLLVLFTLIAFLAADYVVQRRKQRALHAAALRTSPMFTSPEWGLTDDLMLAPNHLWFRKERNNSITVGLDNFLVGLTGAVEKIELPGEGQSVGRGEHPIVLRHKNKSLAINLPVEGQVTMVNREVERTPDIVAKHPYVQGWLFNFIPADTAGSFSSFLHGEAAIAWLKRQNELVKEFLLSSVPRIEFATMQDGGVPAGGVLKGYEADVWRDFEKRFLTTEHDTKQNGEYDHA
jgi:glycine cleavage system H protein